MPSSAVELLCSGTNGLLGSLQEPLTNPLHCDGETGPVGEFRKSWRTACKKAGCVGLFHGLRRFAARALRDAGVPQVTAMKITGHTTDSMWRRYSIVCEADMLDALTKTEAHREAEAARAPQVVSTRG